MKSEVRLDQLLLSRNLVSSRSRAEALIKDAGVWINGKLIKKPGRKFPEDIEITLAEEPMPYVSRGAVKLLGALEEWPMDFHGKTVLDVGASTGGFTELVLQRGAKQVFAVDTGSNQLHSSLQADKRVINLEKTDIRECSGKEITTPADVAVVDVSFISLEKILPVLPHLLGPSATLYVLFKPQFEVGKSHVGKRGIVKDEARVKRVKQSIRNLATELGYVWRGEIPAPITGSDGNQEYLIHLTLDK
ncbi:MAG: TlyA family RNA methyltransferase, partial [Flavobacteriales bacterium]|nr:TlyA family RNA methyltransferase [Flavobacteriales bacterium]